MDSGKRYPPFGGERSRCYWWTVGNGGLPFCGIGQEYLKDVLSGFTVLRNVLNAKPKMQNVNQPHPQENET